MIRVGLLAEKANIKYDPSQTTPEDLASAIESLGYRASVVDTINIQDGKIEFMVCM